MKKKYIIAGSPALILIFGALFVGAVLHKNRSTYMYLTGEEAAVAVAAQSVASFDKTHLAGVYQIEASCLNPVGPKYVFAVNEKTPPTAGTPARDSYYKITLVKMFHLAWAMQRTEILPLNEEISLKKCNIIPDTK